MPKVAIFFSFLLLSPMLINSYAFSGEQPELFYNYQDPLFLDSDIIEINLNHFQENNFKRYLIFGPTYPSEILKNNSLYGVESVHGFFHVSLLSEKTASNLIEQGYYVIEDYKLDFHNSNDVISDVSRIGEISGSTNANQKYNSTGNDIIIAIVDTGVDFSNPDIQHSLARDEFNYPLMLDPDGQGIILTNTTFCMQTLVSMDTIQKFYKTTFLENVTSSVYLYKRWCFS